MTNYEHIKNFSSEEMAWFLMAYSDPCRTCAYKTMDYVNESHKERGLYSFRCVKPEDGANCIGGTEMWLNRKTIEDDDDMFVMTACKRNVEVMRRNAIIEAEEKARKEMQIDMWSQEEDQDDKGDCA